MHRSSGLIRIPLRLSAGVVAAGILAACSMLIEDQLPSPDCPEVPPEVQLKLSCEAAVEAAVGSISSSSPITALKYRHDRVCPPGARGCIDPFGSADGVVIITFADASQVSVYVSIEAGQVHVEPAKAFPPAGLDR